MLKKILLVFIIFISSFKIAYPQLNDEILLANQYFLNGEFINAKSIYEKLYQKSTTQDLVYDNYFQTLIKLKEFDLAEKIVKKRIKDDSDNFNHKINLGLLLKERGDNNQAEKVFNDLIRTMPPDAFYISQVANNFYRINDYHLALKTFLNGRKILGNEREFAFELLNIYRLLKIKDGLITELITILDYNSDFLSMAKSNLARTLETTEDYQLLKSNIVKKIQKTPQNIELADLLAWTHMQLKEYSLALTQTIALDKRTNDNGSRIYALSNIIAQNMAYDDAAKGYNYLINKGSSSPYYVSSRVAVLKIQREQVTLSNTSHQEISILEKNYESLLNEFGKSRKTLFAVKELALLKAHSLNKPKEAEVLLENALNYSGLNAEELASIKLNLADVYIINNDPWEASLLLGQVEKSLANHPIGQEAKFKNAKLSFYNGNFKWAKAQLDVLKASTSQLISNDALDLSLLIQDNTLSDTTGETLKIYAKAEFLREQNQFAKALITLDSITANYPNNELADDVLFSKAKIYKSTNEIEPAIKAYQIIINNHQNSIWADDALYSLAKIYENQKKDIQKALEYYQKLIDDYPGSLYIIDARKRYRILRGDAL